MELSNMLLEWLKGKALEQISQYVGGDTKSTKSIASKALPMILKQLEQNSQDPKKVEDLNNALNSHLWESKIDIDDGAKILWHLFAWSNRAIASVAKASGQDTEKTKWVMSALSSVIMETLGDQKKAAGGFNPGDLTKILAWIGKDTDILAMVMDQDGDGDFDKQDVMKFGISWIKKRFLGKK